MARVTGPSRTELDARADLFAARVRNAIRATLRDVAETTQTVDDLTRIQTAWRVVVDTTLAPRLRATWDFAVRGVAAQLEKLNARERPALVAAGFVIPKVANPLAETFLANATNRLVAIGDVVWYTARGEMLTGLQLGEGVAELKDRVIASANVSVKRAEVIARTEVNSAMNNGAYEQMKALDVPTIKEWIATNDSRTRESHAEVDGDEIAGSEKFMVGGFPMDHPHDLNGPPGETINCVIGSTQVDAPLIQMAMRSWLDGDVIEIRTSAGKTLTVTPNHPVLTTAGWLLASQLKVSDNVLCGNLTRKLTGSLHNEQRRPTQIAEVFDSATSFGVTSDRECVANLHGEWREAKVRVVAEDRQLGLEVVPARNEEIDKLSLTATYGTCACFGSAQGSSLTLNAAGFIVQDSVCATCGVGVLRETSSVVNGGRSVTSSIALGDSACLHFSVEQDVSDCATRDVERLANSDHRFSLDVSTDNVISVVTRPYSGHVYNLSTTTGWYTGNSIITGNCRCTLAWEIDDDEDYYEAAFVADAFHLPGKHNQKSHGNRNGKKNIKSAVKSATESATSLSDILDSDTMTKLLDDPASFDYSSKKSEDRLLSEIVKQRGFDAKPTLVDSLPPGGTRMGRAVTDRKFAEQFLTGDYFAGKGQFGNGTYFLQTNDASNLSKTLSLYGDHQVNATLKPNARTVTRKQIEDEMKTLVADAEQNEKDVYAKAPEYIQRGDMAGFQRDYGRAQRRTQLLRDPGRVAALLGYDAIFVTPDQGDTEVVVLNRGAVQAERSIR